MKGQDEWFSDDEDGSTKGQQGDAEQCTMLYDFEGIKLK